MTTLVLRVKFPPTYPLIYKTLRIDRNLTVGESVGYIAQTVNVPASNNIGLFIPSQKRWLDDGDQLANFTYLENEVPKKTPHSTNASCVYLTYPRNILNTKTSQIRDLEEVVVGAA